MRVMFETFRMYSQPPGFVFHLVVPLLLAMAAVEWQRAVLVAMLSLRMRFHTAHKRKAEMWISLIVHWRVKNTEGNKKKFKIYDCMMLCI